MVSRLGTGRMIGHRRGPKTAPPVLFRHGRQDQAKGANLGLAVTVGHQAIEAVLKELVHTAFLDLSDLA